MPFDRHRVVPFIAVQNRNRRKPCRLDATDCANTLEQIAIEIHRARHVVSVQGRRHLEGDEIFHSFKTGVGRFEVLQAAHEKSRAEQQQETQRHLDGDKTLAKE